MARESPSVDDVGVVWQTIDEKMLVGRILVQTDQRREHRAIQRRQTLGDSRPESTLVRLVDGAVDVVRIAEITSVVARDFDARPLDVRKTVEVSAVRYLP